MVHLAAIIIIILKLCFVYLSLIDIVERYEQKGKSFWALFKMPVFWKTTWADSTNSKTQTEEITILEE